MLTNSLRRATSSGVKGSSAYVTVDYQQVMVKGAMSGTQ